MGYIFSSGFSHVFVQNEALQMLVVSLKMVKPLCCLLLVQPCVIRWITHKGFRLLYESDWLDV